MDLTILDNVGHQRRWTEGAKELGSSTGRCSLTVDKPRWVPEDAARGLKPGERSRAQSCEPDSGASKARAENLSLLKTITGSKVFMEFERAFTGATGLPVSLRPVHSFQLSMRNCRNQGPFCTLVAKENRTCGACLRSQSQAAKAAVGNAHTSVCYAGLCETVVPLRLGNRLIGLLWTGQVFQRKPTEAQFQRIVELLASWGTSFDQRALRDAYFETRVVSREQHSAAIKLLTIFAEHLAMLSNQIVIQRHNAEPPMIARVKDFIREHHAEDLSLPQVALVAKTSPFHFCKLFKQATGLTFTKFLSHVRIESSKRLLLNPQARVSEVAFEAGFQSLTHFNRVFHKMLGQSPTEYRFTLRRRRSPEYAGPKSPRQNFNLAPAAQ